MKTSVKSTHAMKVTLSIRTLFACLVVTAFNLAAIPTWAGDVEHNARKAFDAREKPVELSRPQVLINHDDNSFTLVNGTIRDAQDPDRPNPIPMDDITTVEHLKNKSLRRLLDTLKELRKRKETDRSGGCGIQKQLKEKIRLVIAALEQFEGYTAAPAPIDDSEDCPPKPEASVETKSGNGLQTVTFATLEGRVIVHLPDDIRAGDTISGTVITEPKGKTEEETTKNRDEMKVFFIGTVTPDGKVIPLPTLGFNAAQTDAPDPACPDNVCRFRWTLPPRQVTDLGTGVNLFDLVLATRPKHPSGAEITPGPTIIAKAPIPITQPPFPGFVGDSTLNSPSTAPDLTILQRVQLPADSAKAPNVPTHPSGAVITPGPGTKPPATTPPTTEPNFKLPPIGQQGRPAEIFGAFDGNASNTNFSFGPVGSTTQDFEKNTENVSGGFGLIRPLAESPRKAVFESPTNFTGPVTLRLTEGNVETRGQYRNLGVRLSAPKTDLLKGEKTTLTVEVRGLEGIKDAVPLTLTYQGVITMEGGPYQPLMIQPSQVGADGRYSTTRTITGVQPGGWGATATVVTRPFDTCLQDDSVPSRVVLWNTFTGDYRFLCPGCLTPKGQPGGTAGPAGTSGGSGGTKTGETAQTGGTTTTVPTPPPGGNVGPPLTGTGTMARKGCIITLSHNAPDRRVFARLDACTNSASSTVETPPTNIKFSITDKNISDNTCSSK